VKQRRNDFLSYQSVTFHQFHVEHSAFFPIDRSSSLNKCRFHPDLDSISEQVLCLERNTATCRELGRWRGARLCPLFEPVKLSKYIDSVKLVSSSGSERSIHYSTRIFPRVIQLKYIFRPAIRSSYAYILVCMTCTGLGTPRKSYILSYDFPHGPRLI
jgi:hypothetical protein